MNSPESIDQTLQVEIITERRKLAMLPVHLQDVIGLLVGLTHALLSQHKEPSEIIAVLTKIHPDASEALDALKRT